MEEGRWVTINGTHVFIKDGQSLMDAFIRQAIDNKELNKKIEKIRNAKKENLIVTDEDGNIIHEETGNKFHTGNDNIDYKDRITYHNHPENTYPYPSKQDFKTAEQSDMKRMVVVSQNYTYIYEKDENYSGWGRQGLSSFIENNNWEINIKLKEINNSTLEKYKSGGYKNSTEYYKETKKLQVEYINKTYKDLAQNSGYKLTIQKLGDD